MRRFPAIGLLWYLGAACSAPGARADSRQTPDSADTCVVDRVVDGDTFYCAGGKKVRLIGMDAPELSQGELGRRSRAALSGLMPVGSRVRLELDVSPRDRYGRTLAYVWKDTVMVNEELVRQGWAMQYTVPPDVRYSARFRLAERQARSAQTGLWEDHGFDCTPLEHRRGHC